MSKNSRIPIIDLFAGPGGLGEGFMSVKGKDGKSVFDIKLSIEKDQHAHKTLTWRSFYRQFDKEGKAPPKEYYDAIQESNLKKREELIEEALTKYKKEGKIAQEEAMQIELGSAEWPASKVDGIIRKRLGKNPGKWVLIGGPPCQAYSLAGRSRVGGIDPEDHRVYLYKEYLRIIAKHQPAVFVMENVKGLLSAKVGGESVFEMIKNDLENPKRVFKRLKSKKYKVHSFVTEDPQDPRDYLIKSEEYGIPQRRHRVILLGIREDLKQDHQILSKQPKVSLKKAIGSLPKIRSRIGRKFIGYKSGKRKYESISDSENIWEQSIYEHRQLIKKWNDFHLNGYGSFPNVPKYGYGSEFIEGRFNLHSKIELREWYKDDNLKGVANHESRSHLKQDLLRYLYSGIFAEHEDRPAKLEDFKRHEKQLMPDHKSAGSGKFVDRFKVQLPKIPATTVTSHISKDGHYFIHYDPEQCRSWTVREAARVQTFPDNYLFRGSRTAQYHQVGNAVPPYLANQIAHIIIQLKSWI